MVAVFKKEHARSSYNGKVTVTTISDIARSTNNKSANDKFTKSNDAVKYKYGFTTCKSVVIFNNELHNNNERNLKICKES